MNKCVRVPLVLLFGAMAVGPGCSGVGGQDEPILPRIVVIGFVDRRFELSVFDLESGTKQDLTNRRTITPTSFSLASGEPRIVFSAFTGEGEELFVIDADEDEVLGLTQAGNNYHHPAISPDNKRLAFVSSENGEEPRVLVSDSQVTQTTPLFANGAPSALDPVWSPDSILVAVLMPQHSGGTSKTDSYGIGIGSVSSGRLVADVRGPVDRGPSVMSWSPDSSRLAYSVKRTESYDVFIYDIRSGTEDPLANTDQNESSPVWSPSGNLVAYLASDQRDRISSHIWLFDATLSESRLVSEEALPINALVWIDEKRLLAAEYDSSTDTTTYIVMNVDTDESYQALSVRGLYSVPQVIR